MQELRHQKNLVKGMMTTEEVSDYLHVTKNTVRRWADSGYLKSYRLGPRGDRRFAPEDVRSLLKNGLSSRHR